MRKNQYFVAEKKARKKAGRAWAKSYGMLLKIRKEIAPQIEAKNRALDLFNCDNQN